MLHCVKYSLLNPVTKEEQLNQLQSTIYQRKGKTFQQLIQEIGTITFLQLYLVCVRLLQYQILLVASVSAPAGSTSVTNSLEVTEGSSVVKDIDGDVNDDIGNDSAMHTGNVLDVQQSHLCNDGIDEMSEQFLLQSPDYIHEN